MPGNSPGHSEFVQDRRQVTLDEVVISSTGGAAFSPVDFPKTLDKNPTTSASKAPGACVLRYDFKAPTLVNVVGLRGNIDTLSSIVVERLDGVLTTVLAGPITNANGVNVDSFDAILATAIIFTFGVSVSPSTITETVIYETEGAAGGGTATIAEKQTGGTVVSLDLTGAAPVRERAIYPFHRTSKLSRLRITRTADGATPYTNVTVEVFNKDPGSPPAALPQDVDNTLAAISGIAIGAATPVKVLNVVFTETIQVKNMDVGPTDNIYVAIQGNAGGGAGINTFTIEAEGDEMD